jgi:glycosyltransferase involved in cell wall biosynthesis
MDMISNYPLVSVIIPTKNRDHELLRALKSVKQQTYPNKETIVVYDGTECLKRIADKINSCDYDFRLLRNMKRSGGSGARNTEIYESKGQFIGFLDDDDEWLPGKIEKQMQVFLKAGDEIGIVCVQYFIHNETTTNIRMINVEGHIYQEICKNHIVGHTSNALIRRNILEKVQGFDEDLPAGQDTDLWIRIAKVCQFSTVHEPLAIIHESSIDRITQDHKKQLIGKYRLLYKHWSKFPIRRKVSTIRSIIRLGKEIATEYMIHKRILLRRQVPVAKVQGDDRKRSGADRL